MESIASSRKDGVNTGGSRFAICELCEVLMLLEVHLGKWPRSRRTLLMSTPQMRQVKYGREINLSYILLTSACCIITFR